MLEIKVVALAPVAVVLVVAVSGRLGFVAIFTHPLAAVIAGGTPGATPTTAGRA